MIIAVSEGQYDMAADGITITAERDEVVDFSNGYIQLAQVLLVRADEERYATIADFVADESALIRDATRDDQLRHGSKFGWGRADSRV
jgi:polar amino acid transport system substrate-binding protein